MYEIKPQDQTDQEFIKSYFPKYWFHSGKMMLDHDDQWPELWSSTWCGVDFACKILDLLQPIDKNTKQFNGLFVIVKKKNNPPPKNKYWMFKK